MIDHIVCITLSTFVFLIGFTLGQIKEFERYREFLEKIATAINAHEKK